MEQKTTKIHKEIYEQIGKHYSSVSSGSSRLLAITLKAVKITEQKFKDTFTKQELIGLADAFNGTIIDPMQPFFNKQVLIGQMEDADLYESTSTRHNYNQDELLEKLKALSNFESMILMEFIYKFWNTKKNNPNGFEFFE